MAEFEDTFTCYSSFDQSPLIGRFWPIKVGPPRAVLLFVHGSGEHCQRYRHVPDFFTNYHITCISFDMRGHGLSSGERGYKPHLNALFDDLESVITCIRRELSLELPIIIYAHGTGSVICAAHCIRQAPRWLDCQAMILNPHFRLPIGGNYTAEYTNDSQVVQAYRADPLVHDRWPASTSVTFLELGMLLRNTNVTMPCPILVQHGDFDIITPIQYVQTWVSERLNGDVTLKIWPGHYHELHNGYGKEEIFLFLLEWMTEKIFSVYYL